MDSDTLNQGPRKAVFHKEFRLLAFSQISIFTPPMTPDCAPVYFVEKRQITPIFEKS